MSNEIGSIEKTIKEVRFSFENCESICVPSNCFKTFSYEEGNPKEGDTYMRIEALDCVIKDNGNVDYYYGFANETTPIQRIARRNDISHIDITYEDDSSKEYVIGWFDDCDCNNNENQISELISYKEIHIKIRTNLQTLESELNKTCLFLTQSYRRKLEIEAQIRILKEAS